MTRQICPRSLSYNTPKTSRRRRKKKNLTKNSFPAYGSNPLHDCQILVKQSWLIGKGKKKKWELFQTRKRWRRHDLLSILRDTIYPTIYSYNGKKSGLRLMFSPPRSRFHCCALLVPGTISYLEIRTCNYFKEHHSFRVMCMA